MSTNATARWSVDTEAVLAVGSLFAFGAALAVVLFALVPAANEKYVMLLLGALIGVVKDTFGRYFQATKGAQTQSAVLNDIATTAVGAVSAQPAAVVVQPEGPQ